MSNTLTKEGLVEVMTSAGISEGMKAALMEAFTKLESAAARVAATSGDNVDAVATQQWEESGAPEVKDYQKLQAKIDAAKAAIAQLEDQANAIREPGIAAFRESAKKYAEEHGAESHKKYIVIRDGFTKMLAMAFEFSGKSVPEDLPKLPGKKGKGGGTGGTGERESGGWRPKLARVDVNGTTVNVADGEFPTMADIKTAVGLSDASVTSFSKTLLKLNNDNKEIPTTGVTLSVTVNEKPYSITLYGRPDEKPAETAETKPAE
jgi:hypothetical protein